MPDEQPPLSAPDPARDAPAESAFESEAGVDSRPRAPDEERRDRFEPL